MDSIFRGAVIYGFVWLIFRIAGKRSLAQITTFDAVLLLIISEATQAAMLDNDNSITNSFLLISTMLGLDVVFSCVKQYFPAIEKVLDGASLVILDHDGLHQTEMNKERVDKADILTAARQSLGLANLGEIEYAILEQSGGISVVPKAKP